MEEPDWTVEGWRVQEMLGMSGTATVFRAVHERGVVGALKVCGPFDDAMAAERMLRELNVLSDLRGKRVSNVAEFLDAGRTRDRSGYFIVTAFVDGSSLRALLDEEATLSLSTTTAVIHGLASGLAALHRMDIVHRAIKPSNIMIPEADRFADATLIDLAAVRRLSASTTDLPGKDGFYGTPLYMAPELFAGRGHHRRTDLWALGAVLFECLYGRPPFAARSVSELLKAPSQPLVFPRPIPGIEPVLQRALAKDPVDRFQSAEEFSAALIAVSGG